MYINDKGFVYCWLVVENIGLYGYMLVVIVTWRRKQIGDRVILAFRGQKLSTRVKVKNINTSLE